MLKRSDLINIKNEFENKIDRNKFDTSIIKDGLEKLLFNLNSSNCESDSRFVPYGRMLFLQEELNKNLDENNFIDSYFDISDYLSETRNSANGNPEIIDKNIEYYNDDIICSEEKKILIEMINKYLIAINKKEEMNYMNNEEKNKNHFYKNKEEDTIWWVENPDKVGEHLFSFDKERIFNLFRDYPNELTPEQKEIFDKENPYWADFFKDRTE